jgi:hypothetical protein
MNILYMVIIVFVMALFTADCTQQQKYKPEPHSGTGVAHQYLQRNGTDYSGRYHTRIVVFDPITGTPACAFSHSVFSS